MGPLGNTAYRVSLCLQGLSAFSDGGGGMREGAEDGFVWEDRKMEEGRKEVRGDMTLTTWT